GQKWLGIAANIRTGVVDSRLVYPRQALGPSPSWLQSLQGFTTGIPGEGSTGEHGGISTFDPLGQSLSRSFTNLARCISINTFSSRQRLGKFAGRVRKIVGWMSELSPWRNFLPRLEPRSRSG